MCRKYLFYKWEQCPYGIDDMMMNFCLIKMPAKGKVRRETTWRPPEPGVLKFNVDGAAKGNPGASGIGGVLRNEVGLILGYFSINSGFGSANEAEVKAILKALLFCQQFCFGNLVIESDSTTAVGWVNSHERRPWKLRNEMNKIDSLVASVNCLKVCHVFRESNSLADVLAKKGCNRETPLWECLDIPVENINLI